MQHSALLAGIVATGLLLSACSSNNEAEQELSLDQRLRGSLWQAQELGGQGVPDKPRLTLLFQTTERIAANGGCNRFFGPMSMAGETITTGPLGGTRMACEQAIMDREQQFMRALESAKRVRVGEKEKQLFLDDAGGQPLLAFKRIKN